MKRYLMIFLFILCSCVSKSIQQANHIDTAIKDIVSQSNGVKIKIYKLQQQINTIYASGVCVITDLEAIEDNLEIIQNEFGRLDNSLFLLNNENEKLKLILGQEIGEYKQKLNKYRLISLFCFSGVLLLIFRGVKKYV